MRVLLAVVLLATTLGCSTVQFPDGTKAQSFGDGVATVQRGTQTTDADGETICANWIDANGKTQPCLSVTVKGGIFSGWNAFMSMLNVAATAARLAN